MGYTIQDLKASGQGQGQHIILGAICVLLTVLLVTWFSRKRGSSSQKLRVPPGPKGWPILGALPLLSGAGHTHIALHKLSTTYGPLMFMRLGSMPTLVVSNAKMAKEVLKTNDRVTASRPSSAVITCLSYNYQDITSAPYGNHWRNVRKICTLELFTASRINHFQDRRQHEIIRMVQFILEEAQRGNTIKIDYVFGKMAMNTITQMMWNKSHHTYGNTPADEVVDVSVHLFGEFTALLGAVNIGDFIPSLNWLSMNLQGLNKRMTVVHQKLDNFVDEILREHKQQRSLSTVAAEKISSDADDFVDVLLNHTTQSEADQRISETTIKAILTNMVVAGTDTTTHTLEWALAELVRHPHVMERVQDELSVVVGPNRLVNESDLPKLNYLNAVLKETLRLHPIAAAGVPHASTTDCEIDGFHVPAGSLVLINMWAIHRDPEVWERPLEFLPERFLDRGASAGVDWKGQDFHMIPFGAGRRMCPGMSLASSVLHLALAQVLHCVDWSLPEEQKPEDLDMTDGTGILTTMRVPLILAAKPRLSHDVLFPKGL